MVATADRVDIIMGGKVGATDTWSTKISFSTAGGTPSAADMNGIASGAATLWGLDVWDPAVSGWKPNVNSTTDWSLCKTYFFPAGSAVATVSGSKTITADPGTAGAAGVPPQAAAVISLHTAFAGRKNRGRCYMPAVTPLLNQGNWSSTQALRMATQFRLFLSDWNSATVGALTFHACVGTGSLPAITTVVVDTVVDTQRRRRDKQLSIGTASVVV